MNKIRPAKASLSMSLSCKSCKSRVTLLLVSVRWPPDVNVWSGSGAGYRLAKRQKRNAISYAGTPVLPALPNHPDGETHPLSCDDRAASDYESSPAQKR